MDSFGFSIFLTRGRNSVATKPGDIACFKTHNEHVVLVQIRDCYQAHSDFDVGFQVS